MIQGVFEISEKILDVDGDLKSVMLNEDEIASLAETMLQDGEPSFYEEEDQPRYQTGVYIEILKELVASSINYCYWYGSHDIRPGNVSSTTMYNDVNEAFKDIENHALNFEMRIQNLIHLLSSHRYPLLEQRKRHLLELCEARKAELFADAVHTSHKEENGERLLHQMVRMFQGFSSDIFLKRASLFFIQLHRKYGWWKDDLMKIMHVPSDYQVPKILNHFGCIDYSIELAEKINSSKLIDTHSLEELQIRASTIIACRKLQEATGWTIADVDTYLWTKRKLSDMPFHLSITTDY